MVQITIRITNLKKVQAAFLASPRITEHWLQKAIEASMAELQKKAVRPLIPWREGRMTQSFGEGINIGRLQGSIGPTVEYAIFVDQGTSRMRPRRFMERLAKASEKNIQGHFDKATGKIVNEIAKRAR